MDTTVPIHGNRCRQLKLRILVKADRDLRGMISVESSPAIEAAIGELLTDGYIQVYRPILGERWPRWYQITDRGRKVLDAHQRDTRHQPSGIRYSMFLPWFPAFMAAGVMVLFAVTSCGG